MKLTSKQLELQETIINNTKSNNYIASSIPVEYE